MTTNYLILGGASVSGQQIIKAIHDYHQKDSNAYKIISTSSRNSSVPLVDSTLEGIDFSQKNASELVLDKLDCKIDYFISTLARGRVGLPFDQVNREDIEESCLFSVYPVIYMQKKLKPQRTMVLSGFVCLKYMLQIYGAMLHSKMLLEEFAFMHKKNFSLLRIGYFSSKSSRAIALYTQKAMQKGLYPEYKVYQFKKNRASKDKSISFKQYTDEKIRQQENDYLSSHTNHMRMSDKEEMDVAIIQKAASQALYSSSQKFITNVIGQVIWQDEQKLPWPEQIYKQSLFIRDDLYN